MSGRLKIKVKEWDGEKSMTIPDYVNRKIDDRYAEGQVESIKYTLENLLQSYGRLLEVLAEKKVLKPSDIRKVVEG